MKKLLALVLALVMTLSLCVTSNAAFADADKIEHDEAVEVMNALGVINGKPDGNFDPAGNVTRAEMAKMITIVMLGDIDVAAFKGTATDLTDIAGHWAEGYIKYCYSQGVIAGKGNGIFDPNANVTAVEAAKMLLVAIGYNATVQGYVGSQWSINTIRDAQLSKLFADLSVTSTKVLTRDEAAQMIYNAVDADLIEKTPSLNINTGSITYSYKANDNGKDLLSETFKVKSAEGYLTDASYDSNKKTFTYKVKDALTGGNVASSSGTLHDADVLKSSTDYSELFGRTVKVLWSVAKDGTKNVYGVYTTDAVVSATVGELAAVTGSAKKAELASTKYNLDNDFDATKIYNFAANAVAYTNKDLDEAAANFDNASSLTLVDSNDNGKYDYAIIVPATVAKVTYVGTKSVTAGGVYTFEDNNIYTGVAKNDYAKIVAAANSVYGKAVLTKVDSVEGKVTALKNTTDVRIDGEWYKRVAGTAPAVGDTVALAVVGGYYYNVEVVNGKTLDNVLMVLKSGVYTQGLQNGAEAKVMYAKDGTVATVKISKTESTAVTTNNMTYGIAGEIGQGGLYTFVEKDGWLELTKLADDVIGSYKFDSTGETFDKDAVDAETPGTAGGNYAIADDAIVMVYTTNGTGKSLYTTGKELKSWSANWGTAGQALHSKVNGVDTASVIALYGTAALAATDGSTGYGYVTGTTYFVTEDNTPYAVMDIWTAEGQLTGVKAEGHDGGTNTAPTAALVSTETEYAKGAFITFEKLANGNIKCVNVIGTDYALLGTYVNSDGDTILTLDADGIAGTPTAGKINNKTVTIYVDTDAKTGAEGGELALAQETAIDDAYVLNVHAHVNASDVKVIFVDVNNNLASNSSSFTAVKGSGLSNVVIDSTAKTIKLAGGTVAIANVKAVAAGTDAGTNEIVFQGALAVKVTAADTTDLAADDTVLVVAKDGTAALFTVIA